MEWQAPLPINSEDSPLDFVGDHPALNFVNTLRLQGTELMDIWQTDADVTAWMMRAGLRKAEPAGIWTGTALLREARRLRQIGRKAIETKKAGRSLSLRELQSFLDLSVSHCVLSNSRKSGLSYERIYRDKTPEEYLAPAAEQIAELLVYGDFDLIRHCEGEHCVLWFYDRTKAHRRRWCSPQFCGNRAKVTAFRARNRRP